MSDKLFVDTNILVYAHDRAAGKKHECARELIRGLWLAGERPFVSVQVLQEVFVNLVKKGIAHSDARSLVEDYACWNVVPNTVELVLEGIEAKVRWQLSFWDSLVVCAAIRASADKLWTEDLSPGQRFERVEIVNPLI